MSSPAAAARAALGTAARPLRWGVAGAGRISADWAEALTAVPGAEVVAVAARSEEKAQAFAKKHCGASAKAYGGYAAMAADPDVDAVYVGTLPDTHKAVSTLFIDSGKAVLCEKPMCSNAADATALFAYAKEKGVFCQENMWTRAFPAYDKLREIIASGEIGQVAAVQCDFGFVLEPDSADHARVMELDGGGMGLDIGCYLTQAAMLPFSPADGWKVDGVAAVGEMLRGVDYSAASSVQFRRGGDRGLCNLLYTGAANTNEEVVITGATGFVKVHGPAHCPTKLSVTSVGSRTSSETVDYEFPLPAYARSHDWNYPGSIGFAYQAEEVAKALREGRVDSALWTHEDATQSAELVDEMKRQVAAAHEQGKAE